MAYNFPGVPATAMPPMAMGPMGPLAPIPGPQGFMELAGQGFPPLPPPIPLPGMNDSPLEFSTNKNQPPVARETSEDNSDKRNEKNNVKRERENRDNRGNRDNRRSRSERSDRRERDRERREERNERDRREERRPEERNSINSTNSNNSHNNNSNGNEIPSSSNTSGTQNLGPQMEQATGVWGMSVGYPVMGMGPMGPMGPVMSEMTLGPHMGHTHSYGPMSMGMMSHDGSMIGAQILGPEQIMNDAAQIMSGALPPPPTTPQGSKEIIHCKSCTLFPPNPNAPPPTTRERPPGCRTIFVGGLPENITETIIQEIFEQCGEITTLRLSKKNFCHIRFVLESSVDAAIYLSGYRVRIGSSGDSANTGRLHVDFAQARDDQYEWECRQRQLQREQRHRERVEKERQRAPSSPPPVVHYTDHEASNICEKIKQDDTFMKAVQVVVTWLERGDCTKRNANTFYSMIQSTNSHVRRLLTEKVTYEEELQKAKELMKGRMQGLLIQFSQIERVFTAASHKKVWDHFTKAQRKNIEMWKKQSSEIKAVQLEETLMEGEGEMEVSDSEEEPQRKKVRNQSDVHDDSERLQALKEENDSLRCQLEAYKNEVDLLKSETKSDIDAKDKQMKMLQQTLKGMQEQLMQSRKQQAQDDQKIKDLTVKLNATKKEEPRESEVITLDKDDDINEEPRIPKQLVLSSSFVQITQKDAKLIGLIATFLHIHPFGASVDYLWSYLQKMEPGIKPNEVEALMQRFPQVFKQDLFGIGANMERRWQFSGFNVYRSH
ncbi:ecto-NOX disulfide-thiol exchanger 2 [Hylaeus volcanicus]|uniref:ecto-NOX disulfide-thiol exchanger 2 n=1 Tax=Hylaeus volcanicus TaxID=313075 RepID=UPI0023B81F83|nr:ecto-NOX disulfide-thiol exchanger 2 [Hylaeus volcanicus]XP_053995112.1 ecto-NOX disulfide-thiol exchanger 2 [Hylaeus volcanicus]XP_053995113.1 ecto-NOX disulfide-thiol exchanger 2 [Hylaeus volcanicus]